MSADPDEILRRIEELETRLGGSLDTRLGGSLETRLGGSLDAQRLVIRGRGGRPVIEMAASPEGEPEIVLVQSQSGDETVSVWDWANKRFIFGPMPVIFCKLSDLPSRGAAMPLGRSAFPLLAAAVASSA